jgi:GNAT superfamily N-acetyltransferase
VKSTDLVLRPAELEDLQALLSLYTELADEPRPDIPAAGAACPVLAGILEQPERHLTVAVRDGRVVASADMVIVENLTHGARPWAIVENVIVTAAERGRGVGTAVMGHLLSFARARGCYKVQLLSAPHRQAHTFYESLGFEQLSNGFKRYFE